MLKKLFNRKEADKNKELFKKYKEDMKDLLLSHISTLSRIEELCELNLTNEEMCSRIQSIVRYKEKEAINKIIELDCINRTDNHSSK